MAPVPDAVATSFAINASQKYDKSSSPSLSQVVFGSSTQVVEDSVKDYQALYRGGAVRAPQPAVEDDEDELYSLSPQGKKSQEKFVGAATQASSQQAQQTPINGTQNKDENSPNGKKPGHKERRDSLQTRSNAFDELLNYGASVAHPKEPPRDTTVSKSRHTLGDSNTGSIDSKAVSGTEITNPRTAQLRSNDSVSNNDPQREPRKNSKLPKQDAAAGKTDSTPIQNGHRGSTSKAPPSKVSTGKLSALEALRARRSGGIAGTEMHSAGPNESTPLHSERKKPCPATTIKPAQQSRPGVDQSLATQRAKGAKKTEPTPTQKSTSRTAGQAAETPAQLNGLGSTTDPGGTTGKLHAPRKGGAVKSTKGRPKAGLDRIKAADPIRDVGPDVDNQTMMGRDGAALNRKSKRKQPALDIEPAATKQGSSHELARSHCGDEQPRPSKKARTKDEQAVESTPKDTPQQRRLPRSTKADKRSAGAADTSKRTPALPRDSLLTTDGTRLPNVRTRMMAQNDARDKRDVAEVASENAMASMKPALASQDLKSKTGNPTATGEVAESLEEFAQAVMNFGDHTAKNDPAGSAIENKISDPDMSISAAKVANRPVTRAAVADNNGTARQGDQPRLGASQDNAIVLSDREEPSSPITPLPHDGFDAPATQSAQIVPQSEIRDPKTPAFYPSSLPCTLRPQPRKKDYGKMPSSAKDRPQMISFGRDGPRNQGMTSTRRQGRASDSVARHPGTPATNPMGTNASSTTKHKARKADVPSSAATSTGKQKPNHVAPQSNVADDVVAALDSFTKPGRKVAFDDSKDSIHSPPINEPPHSQECSELGPDDESTQNEGLDEGTFITQDTVPIENVPIEPEPIAESIDPRKFSKPPASKNSQKQFPKRAPTMPHKERCQDATPEYPNAREASYKASPKRGHTEEAAEGPPKKLMRGSNDYATSQAQTSTKDTNAQRLNLVRETMLESDAAGPRPAAKRDSRKPSRVASHGSQKVDMHGSPVPSDMIVPEDSTALETFNRQAHASTSPESMDMEEVQAHSDDGVHRGDLITLIQDRLQHQVGPLSSNVKRLPSAPHQESQAITGFARVDAEGALVDHLPQSHHTDPFTRSDEAHRKRSRMSSSSSFVKQLRRAASKHHEHANNSTNRANDGDDPEKTLVEHNEAATSPSSSDTSSTTDESASAQHDLHLWRNALLPHQMNLFDELVTVSHRLIQNLVERETAEANMFEDFQRRALALVEEMERSHTKTTQNLTDALEAWKTSLRKEFAVFGKKLKACTQSVDVEGLKHREHGIETRLQDVVTTYG